MTLEQSLLKLDETYNNQYSLEYNNCEWALEIFDDEGNTSYQNVRTKLKHLIMDFYNIKISDDVKELSDIPNSRIEISLDEANGSHGEMAIIDEFGDELCSDEIKLNSMEDLIQFLYTAEDELSKMSEAYWEDCDPMGTFGLSYSDF